MGQEIGLTDKLILESLLNRNRCATELYDELKGRESITSVIAVAHALGDLEVRGLVRVVGRKTSGFMGVPEEPVYSLTYNGRQVVEKMSKK